MKKNTFQKRDEKDDSPVESKEEIRSKQREYYHKHKDHIQEIREKHQTSIAEKQCIQLGIPLTLAPYIKFLKPVGTKKDRISLKFDSRIELFDFLIEFMREGNDLEELMKFSNKLKQEKPKE